AEAVLEGLRHRALVVADRPARRLEADEPEEAGPDVRPPVGAPEGQAGEGERGLPLLRHRPVAQPPPGPVRGEPGPLTPPLRQDQMDDVALAAGREPRAMIAVDDVVRGGGQRADRPRGGRVSETAEGAHVRHGPITLAGSSDPRETAADLREALLDL